MWLFKFLFYYGLLCHSVNSFLFESKATCTKMNNLTVLLILPYKRAFFLSKLNNKRFDQFLFSKSKHEYIVNSDDLYFT